MKNRNRLILILTAALGTLVARSSYRSLRVFLCFTVMGLASRIVAAEFFIHDGDRVAFLGDSITEGGKYTTYLQAYALTRHPQWRLTFRNVGWRGDTAWLRNRYKTDETALFAADNATQQKMVNDAVEHGLGTRCAAAQANRRDGKHGNERFLLWTRRGGLSSFYPRRDENRATCSRTRVFASPC